MEIISALISILSIIVLVTLIVYVIRKNIKIGWLQLYILSGFITTCIMIFIVVIVFSLIFKNGELATKVWAIYFTDNLPLEVVVWFLTTFISGYYIE